MNVWTCCDSVAYCISFLLMKIFHNACLHETLDFTIPSSFLAFWIWQKEADGFSANSAAAYRSFFSFSITPPAGSSISSHKTPVLFLFVLHSLTKFWQLASTINKNIYMYIYIISNLRLSSFTTIAVAPTLIISQN